MYKIIKSLEKKMFNLVRFSLLNVLNNGFLFHGS